MSALASGIRDAFEVRVIDEDGVGEAVGTSITLTASAAVAMPDSGLRACVETALELASGAPITQGELAKLGDIEELSASRCSISVLTGLEFATNLKRLDLSGNEISNISPLSKLTSLTGLDLSDNELSDVSPLSNLTQLGELDLSGNELSDISALGALDSLMKLYLNRNAVGDISPLVDSGLSSGERHGYATYADLRNNPLGDAQADHVEALREAGAVVVWDDGGHRVPLFLSSSSGFSPQGFVRVINHSAEAGSVSIEAVDETGERRDPVSLAIGAGQVLHFNAEDLERGSAAKGLRGIGEADGDWRLILRSELDIEVLGYARTPDGFVTSLHDLAPEACGTSWVPMFNPGNNRCQVSRLRLVNPNGVDGSASILASNDKGLNRTCYGTMSFSTPACQTLDLTAAQLESGDVADSSGGIGNGAGKWRLTVGAYGQRVMSLLQSPTGHLANISTSSRARGGCYRVPLFLAASSDIQSFLRIVNLSFAPATVTLRAFDSSGVEREPVVLTLKSNKVLHVNSRDLETGNAAKGLPGIGAGTGDWHLEASANRRFEVLAYAHTADGFVTSLHDIAPRAEDDSLWIPFFNPGSNRRQASRLRLVNWGESAAEATITGVDDAGNSPRGAVRVTIPARSARDYMAWQLETGNGAGLTGALGDGSGKWRLRVSSTGDVEAASLLCSSVGYVTNLSTTPRYPRE